MNDSELVEGLRRQDPAAVRHLSECLLPSVWRFVYFRVKGDQHLAEDIVSDTVLALVKAVAAPGVDVISPSAWLRTVATHKIQDHFRAAARVQHLIDQAAAAVHENKVPEPSCQEEANERRAAIRKVMDDMPEPHRLALEWKYIDHLSVREIAGRMAATEKSVEAILFRARREFRDGLGGLHREDVPFRVNGHGKHTVNGRGQQGHEGRSSVSGSAGTDSQAEPDAQQQAGFNELKQRQS